MRIIDGFVLRDMCGTSVIIAEGAELLNYGKLMSLNDSAAFLWRSVEGMDFTEAMLADLLQKEYGIDRELAERDAGSIAEAWLQRGLVSR